MNYNEARPKIKEGDIIAQTHRSWKSWYDIQIQFVRFFTQSEYSHVGVVIEQDGRLFVIEAVTPRIRPIPLSQIGDFYLVTNKRWSAASRSYAFAKIGGIYSKWEAVKGFFNRTKEKNGLWQCAELVREILRKSWPALSAPATPSHIVNALLLDGATIQFVKGAVK